MPHGDEASTSAGRILLFEDDPALAEMFSYRLRVEGYEVTVATSGQEGLRLARRLDPDLILLDIGLPRMDGIEVLEARLTSPALSDIPVVLLTAYSEEDYRTVGLDLGATAFVVKTGPTPSELARLVKGWLRPARG